jgi:hypothetical protein
VLFGGIDSARFVPGSEAMVQQTVMPELRSTRVDLRTGAAFSKVGMRPGEKQDYEVHTPFGVASARGTDFVCVTLPDRTDVWVAQGTVELDQPTGELVGTVKSSGKGTLQIIRFPVIDDARAAMMATAETMTAAMNFIPTVNLKVKTLHDQMAQGVQLTPQEKKYLSLMKHVPCLLRLELVEPPPAPVPPPKPVTVISPSKAKPVTGHVKKARAIVSENQALKATPVEVAKPAVTETPLPVAEPEPATPTEKPVESEESGMTAEPLNHMGRIMQLAPRDDFSPRAQPVKLPDGSNETQSTNSDAGTNSAPAPNDAPIEHGPHDTTP